MHSKEEAHLLISALVERFTEQLPSYKKSDYNETLTRRDFIDPFFKALGWDMNNSAGNAEAYREVIHEDKIKIGSATKAPDYSFRLPGGKRLFFVEAKKPSVYVKDEILPAYQVRRYAWSAKLPISILTDFEEFAVYDCKKKPNISDKASTSRIKYITYKDYLPQFDFIWDNFSKEKVLKGGFDKFVQNDSNKKGTSTVDKEFLVSLDEWRKQLAQNIALRNIHLNEDEINYTVQQTIDRLIFLRIAEDRGVEEYGRLKTFLHGDAYYQNLFQYFKEADSKYNSGLFNFKKDTLSAGLALDNKVIKNILNELYYPISPYEFSVLSVEILGSAYEQFLGKQIRLTAGHKAVIEEKPEVRKAGGVYYTPQYIVEYIVKNTVGKLAEGKTPQEIETLKIVDPACGSGSFLIGAYEYLLNYHHQYYQPKFEELTQIAASNEYTGKQRTDAQKERNKLPLTLDGNLTTSVKKQILLNNIFGVDIDTQAVEVTKLSLMLKCMEGETKSSINAEMNFGERVLPTLDDNIKCGNSLIDVDFYDGQLDFEPGIEKKVKPFSWEKAFPTIFKQEGFDCVIGNPPWGADLPDESLHYLRKRNSQIVTRMIDSYMYFIYHSIQLLRINGLFGMIIPSTFLNQADMQLLRRLIVEKLNLQIIVNLGEKVFGPNVLNTSTILLFENNQSDSNEIIIGDLRENLPEEKAKSLNELKSTDKIEWVKLVNEDSQRTYFTFNISGVILLNKLKKEFQPFKEIVDGQIQRGISPDYAKAFVINSKEAAIREIEKKILRPLVLGKHISRYCPIESDDSIIYLTSKDNIDDYPNAKEYLSNFRKFITCREVAEGKHPWYALHRPRDPNIFAPNKFIGLTTTKKLCFAYDTFGYYATDALFIFKTKSEINELVILGILHSKLFQFLYDTTIQGGQRVIPQVKAVFLYDIPFPCKSENKIEKSIHDNILHLVETMLHLQKEKQQTTLPHKLDQLNTRIEYTDEKINKLVFDLYGLEEEERRIVENK